MRPSEKKTTTESIELYKQSLEGNNYSVQSIKAYLGDLAQFITWLQTRRVDWDIPHRIERIDIVQFINHLAEHKASAITRKRKLAAIRGFLKFCKDNQIIYGNPADTIEGPIREERDPSILLKTEYKALLQVAGGNSRDLAIVMLFLQTGLRVSELVNLKLTDIDFTSREITVRQGKGRKDRVVPLVKQAETALKAYLKVRDAQPEYDEVFIARNGTSMDPRTVRYRIHKYYKDAGIKKKASVHTLRHTSVKWTPGHDVSGDPVFRIRFDRATCHACPTRAICTAAKDAPRQLTVRPQAHHEALQAARQRQGTPEFKAQYALRSGVESSLSQGIRRFDVRQSRYRGLARTHLQQLLTATAMNIVRVIAWLKGESLGERRRKPGHFARLAPHPLSRQAVIC
jgi:site-specific recombinase XerD